MTQTISLYLMALFYIVPGVNHFRSPQILLTHHPTPLPYPHLINWMSGAAKISFGILFQTTQLAAWGIIALLIAVFLANIYHLIAKGAGMKIPMWGLWVRLPIQFVFIWWAYTHT